jgi:SOS-response transcriptional repressor LexA
LPAPKNSYPTKIQEDILEYICATIEEEGRQPTQPEIQARFGLKNSNQATYHLSRLVHFGKLKRRPDGGSGYVVADYKFRRVRRGKKEAGGAETPPPATTDEPEPAA